MGKIARGAPLAFARYAPRPTLLTARRRRRNRCTTYGAMRRRRLKDIVMLSDLLLLLSAAVSAPTMTTLEADRAAHAVVLTAHGEGAQIYECKAAQGGALLWSFREPIASLIVDGKTVGRHYAGPHWALDDGSLVHAKMVMTVAGVTGSDVAWLKLSVSENAEAGALSSATLVYRVNTRGGKLTGICPSAGMLSSVPYSADYIFAR
jgi:hypothetical protein